MFNFLHTLWDTGLRLRCPVCEQGTLFKDYFTMNRICPHCSVRFERHEGEVVGGMSISIVVTAVIFLVGYITAAELTNWPIWVHLAMWVPYSIFFPIFFYRYSRALWVVILHQSGDVHWDYEPYQESEVSIIDAFRKPTNEEPASDVEEFPFREDDLI